MENNWIQPKLKSLAPEGISSLSSRHLSDKKEIIESELKTLSVVKQCKLLTLSRSSLYYEPAINENKVAVKEEIKSIFVKVPIY
ncbi:MAG: hypothetical protein JJW00_06030 [Sulfurimonas sp.]|nr:hypothetical protein [Sulfurimonas sp.]